MFALRKKRLKKRRGYSKKLKIFFDCMYQNQVREISIIYTIEL